MAGRTINLNKTVKLHEVGEHGAWSTYNLWDIIDETWNDRNLERFKGETIDKCSDEPYLFSPGPIRTYTIRRTSDEYNDIIYSSYTSLIGNHWSLKFFTKQIDISVILIADLMFAGAVFKEGKAVVQKEFASVKVHNTSKSEKDIFRERVKTVLNNWEDHLNSSNVVFIRCTKEDKDHFFEGKGGTGESKYWHVPFETGKPTLAEVDRVHDRVLRCVIHGPMDKTLRDLQNETKSMQMKNKVKDLPVSSFEENRRFEKKKWPWMDSTLPKRLVEYVEKDDGNALYDEVGAHSMKSELVEYLNASHEKFNNGTFLHFAVQKDAVSVIEVLLEFGCDPTSSDANKKVPFDYCGTSEIQKVFIEFKQQNPSLFNWNKSNVSEKANMALHNERKKVAVFEKKADVSRRKRSEKLQGKKIKQDE